MYTLLRQPKVGRLFLAHGQSQLGTGAAYVALLLLTYDRLHSAWAVSLVLLSEFLPSMLLGPYCGVLADRHPRRTLAILAELVSAGAFAGLALASSFATIISLALLAGVGGALFRPAVKAALPTLVADEDRTRATALYGGLQNLGFTLGPALCGLLLLLGPASCVLLLDAGTFLVSAVLIAGVPLGQAAQRDDAQPTSAWREARDGAAYVAGERPVAALLLVAAMTVLCAALVNVADPVLAVGTLHAGSFGYSMLMTAFGLGLLSGSAYTSRLGSRASVLRAHFLGGVAVTAVAMLGCATAGNLAWALAPFALAGFANSMILTPQIRLLQELVQERFRGRVFGLNDSLESACFALAFLAAGVIINAGGPRTVYVLSGVLLAGTTVVGALSFKLAPSGQAIAPPRRFGDRLRASGLA